MYRCLLLLSLLAAVSAVKYLNVSSSTCEDQIDLDATGDVYLSYTGAGWGSSENCTFEFKTNDSSKEICVDTGLKTFSIGCFTTMEYYEGNLTKLVPDKSFRCLVKQLYEWCSSFSKIWVVFKGGKDHVKLDSTSNNIQLRIYKREPWGSNLVSHSVYVIIGVVVGVVFLVVVVVGITISCKRKSRQGTVYRSPQQAMPESAVQSPPVGSDIPIQNMQ